MEIAKTKAKIERISKRYETSNQSVWDVFFFEHFLLRISKSPYADRFVFKGGFLLECVLGVEQRTTMDLDFKYRGQDMSDEELVECFDSICRQDEGDGLLYETMDIMDTAVETKYKGKTIRIKGLFHNVRKIFGVDIVKGDIVTPNPEYRDFTSRIDGETSFRLLVYNKESIIAEKLETFVAKGRANSRIKDLFDLKLLKEEGYDPWILNAASINTFHCRGTELSRKKLDDFVLFMKNSDRMRWLFQNYSSKNTFAKGVSYDECMEAVDCIASSLVFETPLDVSDVSITLVRHGQDEQDKVGGWSSNALTEQGVKDVGNLCKSIGNDYDAIVSSDLPRAAETARIISKAIGIPVTYDQGFRETNNGDLKDMSKDKFLSNHRHFIYSNLEMDEEYPNGESPNRFFERIGRNLERLIEENKGKRILLVTHGGVITAILCLVNGWRYSNKLSLAPPTASIVRL